MATDSFDAVISGGFVVDGTGAPGYYSDVGIRDGRIAHIGDLAGAEADRRVDATGKIVAPGHVTQHTHYDAALFWDPYCSNSGENGVTTVVNANCGFGFAPVKAPDIDRTMAMMATTEQILGAVGPDPRSPRDPARTLGRPVGLRPRRAVLRHDSLPDGVRHAQRRLAPAWQRRRVHLHHGERRDHP